MKKKYTVVKPLIHDGVEYGRGVDLELEEENASYLLAWGSIAETDAKAKKTAAPAGEEK